MDNALRAESATETGCCTHCGKAYASGDPIILALEPRISEGGEYCSLACAEADERFWREEETIHAAEIRAERELGLHD